MPKMNFTGLKLSEDHEVWAGLEKDDSFVIKIVTPLSPDDTPRCRRRVSTYRKNGKAVTQLTISLEVGAAIASLLEELARRRILKEE